MRIISRQPLVQFSVKHPDAKSSLDDWYHAVNKATWSHHADLKKDYPNADLIRGSKYVFNISGNKYRLVADVLFRVQRVYIHGVYTHTEYDALDL